MPEAYFEVLTPLGILVRTTASYWARIVTFKHPVMRGREREVLSALAQPHRIHRSRSDPTVHLYYAPSPPHHLCVVVKCLDTEGFIVTAYLTDAIKEGELLWAP